MFVVETNFGCETFSTYRAAEIFCGMNGISCENIYEE